MFKEVVRFKLQTRRPRMNRYASLASMTPLKQIRFNSMNQKLGEPIPSTFIIYWYSRVNSQRSNTWQTVCVYNCLCVCACMCMCVHLFMQCSVFSGPTTQLPNIQKQKQDQCDALKKITKEKKGWHTHLQSQSPTSGMSSHLLPVWFHRLRIRNRSRIPTKLTTIFTHCSTDSSCGCAVSLFFSWQCIKCTSSLLTLFLILVKLLEEEEPEFWQLFEPEMLSPRYCCAVLVDSDTLGRPYQTVRLAIG